MRGIEKVPWIYDAMLSFCEWLGLGRWRAKLVAGAQGLTLDEFHHQCVSVVGVF